MLTSFHHTHQIIQNGELKKITEPLENPIGRYFSCDIKNFDISSGGVLFAYSSIFEFTSKNFTYNIAEVSPFSSDEWIRLFNTDVSLFIYIYINLNQAFKRFI